MSERWFFWPPTEAVRLSITKRLLRRLECGLRGHCVRTNDAVADRSKFKVDSEDIIIEALEKLVVPS